MSRCPLSYNFFFIYWHFPVFLSPSAFDWAPFCLSMSIFYCRLFFRFQELLNEPHIVWLRGLLKFNTEYAQTSNFGRKFCFHYFYRFLGPKSFRMSPILYCLAQFLHFTPNMPKRPLFDAKFFYCFFFVF